MRNLTEVRINFLCTSRRYWGSGAIAPVNLNLGTKWNRVISFTQGAAMSQGKEPPATDCVVGRMLHRIDLDASGRRHISGPNWKS